MAVRWVFFDIGDVLFDEDAQHLYYLHTFLLAMRRHRVDVEWDAFHTQVLASVCQKPDNAVVEAARFYVPDENLWAQIYAEARAEYAQMRKPRPYGMLLDNITPVLAELSREYRLGVIANQHPPILQALEDYGIGRYFGVTAINEVVGLSKPDPAFFRWALEQANCPPEEAVMVGDRADNDIAPARSIGMRTVRFQRGLLYSPYEPLSDAERADIVVTEAAQIAPAIHRLADGQK